MGEVVMARKLSVVIGLAFCFSLLLGMPASAQVEYVNGKRGIGDKYFPLDGNGGIDVLQYALTIRYNPFTNQLDGAGTLRIRATQNLSRFNLDLEPNMGLVDVTVQGASVNFRHRGHELEITPAAPIDRGTEFNLRIFWRGNPEPIIDDFGESGFLRSDDGALIIGEPHVAASWFPVNDHPADKATYTFTFVVPQGLEVVSNGRLITHGSGGGISTWIWGDAGPMASYLVGASIGQLEIRSYRRDGIRYWDAVDPALFPEPFTGHTGEQFAWSQQADSSYKRLTRTISVPAGGGTLDFWANRDTEEGFDYFFVEAHTPGMDDWDTLPDLGGHTNHNTAPACPAWLEEHPFLLHYQRPDPNGADECLPDGSSGEWFARSGTGGGWEPWSVDLSHWAGSDVEVSLTYVSDGGIQLNGVQIDDIVTPAGPGSTSFEADGNVRDGWVSTGPPAGSPGNLNNWKVGTAADTPPGLGDIALASLDRQPEILAFESATFGPYPFKFAGGIVDNVSVGFSLENQTRPIYSPFAFFNELDGELTVVHELAHQWFGDSVAVQRWKHIWLNEGFATYAEWLWSEDQGLGTAQEIFGFWYDIVFSDPDDPFWDLRIGNPGPVHLFDFPVYIRGGMTLHQLRLRIGDGDFFRILRRWTALNFGGHGTTAEFIELAERISGRQLDDLFQTWLFTRGRPDIGSGMRHVFDSGFDMRHAPAAARSFMQRMEAMEKASRGE
jgi:hypothetical protein